MASHLTDDSILSHRLIKRRYVQIPKDQQAHLANAWWETLNHGPQPMFNVPDSVLQDVKDLHQRNHPEPTQQSASSAQRPSTANSPNLTPRSSGQNHPTSSPQRDVDDQCSWSPSPDHHLRAQRRSPEDEPAGGHQAAEPEMPLSSPISRQPSLPPKSPPKRKIPSQFINIEPQSSGGHSEGLDIEAPGFVTQVMEPSVNRTALRVIATASGKPEPTPPSAQMPIGAGERPIKSPPAKKRRVMEDAKFSSNHPKPTEPISTTISGQKPNDSNQNSLTTITSASSPSLGTQPSRQRPIQARGPKIQSDPAPFSTLTPTFEGRHRDTAAQHLAITESLTPGLLDAPPPAQRNADAKGALATQTATKDPVQLSQASPTTSYEAFRLVYPDYSRSSRDFVIALLSVKQLKRDRALHDSMYDDFIRAYSSDYFAYVSECSRKQVSKILPGLQWYNEHVDNVLYTKKLVRKDNLSDFLEVHTKEAHSIRRTLADSQSTDSADDDSDEEMEDPLDEEPESEQDQREPEVVELDNDDVESRVSPEFHMESPGAIIKASPFRNQMPARIDKTTEGMRIVEDVERGDNQMEVTVGEDDCHEAPVKADNTKRYPDFHPVSAGAVKVLALSKAWQAPQARKSPTPSPTRSLASQEYGRELMSPILSSSPGFPTIMSPRAHTGNQSPQIQRIHIATPPQRAARSSSKGLRNLPTDDEDDEDKDTFQPDKSLPPRTAATGSGKKSPIYSEARGAEDDDDSNGEGPTSPPQRAFGPRQARTPRHSFAQNEHDGGDSGPKEPPAPQQDTKSLPTDIPRHGSALKEENSAHELPTSLLPRKAERLPRSRSPPLPVDEKDDTDEDDAFDPPPPKEVTQGGPVPKTELRSSTATKRPTISSTARVVKPAALGQRSVTGPEKSDVRPSLSLGTGKRNSVGSSVGSSANVPWSKKKSSETHEQRSLRLKAFMAERMEKQRRLSSGIPASTSASKG